MPYGDVNLLKLPDDVPDEKGLFLSDVIATSWNAVVDTGVKKGDVVAIWGAGPIGQMAADFSFLNGASRVIIIDSNWRLDYVKEKYPRVETVNFKEVNGSKGLVAKLKEMVDGRGPDVAIECVAGEYPKNWLHTIELATGLETDTSELINEMIESVKNYGRCGVTGVYVGFTNHFNIGKWHCMNVLNSHADHRSRIVNGTWYSFDRSKSTLFSFLHSFLLTSLSERPSTSPQVLARTSREDPER